MHTIIIPHTITYGDKPYPFVAWCAEALDAFPPCGSSPQARALHADLHVILIAAVGTGSLTLTTQQHAILAAATAAFRMQPYIGRLCVAYDQAVAGATDDGAATVPTEAGA